MAAGENDEVVLQADLQEVGALVVRRQIEGGQQAKARFDVVSIRSAPLGPEVEIIRNAFDLLYG
jgi:hypothetical protein